MARASAVLRERLREAPSLEELGRLVGCSPFCLGRLFSPETGQTIPLTSHWPDPGAKRTAGR